MVQPKNNETSKNVTIINEFGVHARSAAKIAEMAQHSNSKIWIIKDSVQVDAKSVIDILTLACGKGTSITIKVDSRSDIEILNGLVKLIEDGFGE